MLHRFVCYHVDYIFFSKMTKYIPLAIGCCCSPSSACLWRLFVVGIHCLCACKYLRFVAYMRSLFDFHHILRHAQLFFFCALVGFGRVYIPSQGELCSSTIDAQIHSHIFQACLPLMSCHMLLYMCKNFVRITKTTIVILYSKHFYKASSFNQRVYRKYKLETFF